MTFCCTGRAGVRPSPWPTTASRAGGWGLFNIVEGLLGHQILGIHHVHGGPHQLWWDMGFLILGVILLVGGYLLQRSGQPFDPGATDTPSTAAGLLHYRWSTA
ncbi:DUF2243 domain-containing protein [Streptomyces sp. NPDC057284]|uniref:DUF2243 domain-containing protein n=1 Tax=Streptomyces sp. NPDC057284 TaxID=3346083 RepID=UPI0036386E49